MPCAQQDWLAYSTALRSIHFSPLTWFSTWAPSSRKGRGFLGFTAVGLRVLRVGTWSLKQTLPSHCALYDFIGPERREQQDRKPIPQTLYPKPNSLTLELYTFPKGAEEEADPLQTEVLFRTGTSNTATCQSSRTVLARGIGEIP